MAYILKKKIANRKNYGNSRSLNQIDWIVLHYTANDGDTDENNGNYFANNIVQASAHYFVDSNSITQSVPDNYVAWSVGGKKYGNCIVTGGGKYYKKVNNTNSLSIELCDDRKGGGVYPSDETINNALAFVKVKMKEYGIPASHVIRHFDVTGKPCPAYWCGNITKNKKWLTEFHNKLTGDIVVDAPAKPSTNQLYRIRKSWKDVKSQIGAYTSLANAKEACKPGYTVFDWNGKAVYSLQIAPPPKPPIDHNDIAIDGSWGKECTKATQRYFKTDVDGIVSRQPLNNKKYLPNAYTGSWKFTKSYKGGSLMIKALQRHIGASADGHFGKGSVMALQRFLNGKGYNLKVDGSMGKATVMAWQRYLNAHN